MGRKKENIQPPQPQYGATSGYGGISGIVIPKDSKATVKACRNDKCLTPVTINPGDGSYKIDGLPEGYYDFNSFCRKLFLKYQP